MCGCNKGNPRPPQQNMVRQPQPTVGNPVPPPAPPAPPAPVVSAPLSPPPKITRSVRWPG